MNEGKYICFNLRTELIISVEGQQEVKQREIGHVYYKPIRDGKYNLGTGAEIMVGDTLGCEEIDAWPIDLSYSLVTQVHSSL